MLVGFDAYHELLDHLSTGSARRYRIYGRARGVGTQIEEGKDSRQFSQIRYIISSLEWNSSSEIDHLDYQSKPNTSKTYCKAWVQTALGVGIKASRSNVYFNMTGMERRAKRVFWSR